MDREFKPLEAYDISNAKGMKPGQTNEAATDAKKRRVLTEKRTSNVLLRPYLMAD